ncbi:MAG: L-threonylcarbamoyladenylate synthase [Candidatus Micrarchaeota archaeon]|nr:L-threonylcarbamoyladenylate synthase [Candidatus Micrarchaeota archaeon]
MDALQCLRSGNVILLQTDTLWGLSCDATNDDAVEAVIDLKHRPENKSMIILVADKDMLAEHAQIPEGINIDNLTGVSLILKCREGTPLSKKILQNGNVCARIPDSKFLTGLISDFGKPIVSTSANISGAELPKSLDTIEPSIREEVCAVIENPECAGVEPQPSTIIDLSVPGKLKIVRVGKNIDKVRRMLAMPDYSFQWPASDMKYPLLPLQMWYTSNLKKKS